jgi:hypothetical protein
MPGGSPGERIKRFQRALQDSILRDYPNPERTGCQGSEVLRQLASRERSEDDPAWDHVLHCGPCYGEFLELRGAVQRGIRRRRLKWLVPAAACVLVAAAVTIFVLRQHPNPNEAGLPATPAPTAAAFEPATLDMRDLSPTRGAEDTLPAKPRLLPRKPLDLTVLLPIGSPEGVYELQLLDKTERPLLQTEAHADIRGGLTFMHLKLDLASYPPGDYRVRERRVPGGWIYSQVRLE